MFLVFLLYNLPEIDIVLFYHNLLNLAMTHGKLILIVGPSGSGKGTVIKRLAAKYPEFVYPVSYTTREPRAGEVDGDVYHFVSKAEFERMIEVGDFLEYATVHSDNYYGTSKREILESLEAGSVVVREVDIQGFHSIRKLISAENLVSIFMEVTDENDLRGRIMRRGKLSEDEVRKRMDSAKKEIAQADDCDFRVENKWGAIDECVAHVERIILQAVEGGR